MDMLCPECMGPLATTDGRNARCTVHGGQYQIMFSRDVAPRQPAREDAPVAPPNFTYKIACPSCGQRFEAGPQHSGATIECTNCGQSFEIHAPDPMCKYHAQVIAAYFCSNCGVPLCTTCAFDTPMGGHWCPECAAPRRTAPAIPAPPVTPAGLMCANHPAVPAIHRCAVCNTPVCSTCDFAFPGGIHVCPACASKPQRGVGKRRKKALISSYVLAVWCTLGLAVLFSGALARYTHTPDALQALGVVLTILVYIPSIAGTGLAVSSLDRRLGNPSPIWISVVWNGIILAVLLLLTIFGIMK